MVVRALDQRLSSYENPLRKTTEGFFKFWKRQGDVEIYIVNSLQIRKLNFKYRGKDKPTDVLAIEPPDFPGNQKNFIGEIYLNPSSLKSKPYDIHFALVHGLLHLLGFTHKGKNDNIEMEKLERKVLEWLKHTY